MTERNDRTDRTPPKPEPRAGPADGVAATVKAYLESSGLLGDGLINALRTDDNGRVFDPRVEVASVGALDQSDNSQAQRLIQFALRKEPSGRWLALLRRRTARLKVEAVRSLESWFAALRSNPGANVAAHIAELIHQLDAETAALRREAARVSDALAQLNRQLQPIQAEIERALAQGSASWLARLFDLNHWWASLGRGVGLMARAMTAAQLVNDREAYACSADLIAAAIGIIQESRQVAEAESKRLAQLRDCLVAARQRAAQDRARALARLGAHPYAQVEATHPRQAERIGATVTAALPTPDLTAFLALNEAQLLEAVRAAALEQVRRATAHLDLVRLMEDEAHALAAGLRDAPHAPAMPLTPDELVLQALQTAYAQATRPALRASPNADAYELLLVGVTDETSPGFNFERATLASTGLRDRVLFLHVRTGLCLRDLAGFDAMSRRLEAALQRRNYYVLDVLAACDPGQPTVAPRAKPAAMQGVDDPANGNGRYASASSEDAPEEAAL
ncbi:MAG: hypothetical protein RMN52_04615 [Anaerolineae bacterium]|nr:hypothetical protein [Candidatus Roseilinea sp.]MDW8449264.1 hypothetical protein [Anaerolineae bacterium]